MLGLDAVLSQRPGSSKPGNGNRRRKRSAWCKRDCWPTTKDFRSSPWRSFRKGRVGPLSQIDARIAPGQISYPARPVVVERPVTLASNATNCFLTLLVFETEYPGPRSTRYDRSCRNLFYFCFRLRFLSIREKSGLEAASCVFLEDLLSEALTTRAK